ncbi:hypothetical protein AZSI13_07670 [Azospira sp. I13]|uniref:hypothetical protein n=1 Tax=Azospira sp. I13 TaxID=1765050 RepID=UPI000D46020A|nr:hypothetical protein [Azospira sp. I13]GBG01440.1 hypothetical protein AZSI13_07670 [Azospira sp. I13]
MDLRIISWSAFFGVFISGALIALHWFVVRYFTKHRWAVFFGVVFLVAFVVLALCATD